MSFDPVPWFVGGGAEHSPDVARLVAHAATGGASGVISSTDLRVTEMPAPTGTVRVYPGACVIPNTYPGVTQQSYMARSASVTDLPVTPTGSAGGRSDMVIVRVDDPQFGGAVPADPVSGPYVKAQIIEGVAGDATDPSAYVSYPAIALARIDLPANTATVTTAMITDLRKMPLPRRERRLLTVQPTTAYEHLVSADVNTFVNWPAEAQILVDVPEWATEAVLVGDISGAFTGIGNTFGYWRVVLGGYATQGTYFDLHSEAADGWTRHTVKAGDTFPIPPALRGTQQPVWSQGSKAAATTAELQSDSATFVSFDIEFREAPSQE